MGLCSTKNGGFLGFWWNIKKFEDTNFEYYLQLEFSKLCFKIHPYNREKPEKSEIFIEVYYIQNKRTQSTDSPEW